MASQKRGPWTPQEDQRLLGLVEIYGASNWVKIGNELGTRSAKQCRERYHQNLDPKLDKSAISDEEGARILELHADMGPKWAEIARRLGNRSDNQVKNWYNGGKNKRNRQDQRMDRRTQKQMYRTPTASHDAYSHYGTAPNHMAGPQFMQGFPSLYQPGANSHQAQAYIPPTSEHGYLTHVYTNPMPQRPQAEYQTAQALPSLGQQGLDHFNPTLPPPSQRHSAPNIPQHQAAYAQHNLDITDPRRHSDQQFGSQAHNSWSAQSSQYHYGQQQQSQLPALSTFDSRPEPLQPPLQPNPFNRPPEPQQMLHHAHTFRQQRGQLPGPVDTQAARNFNGYGTQPWGLPMTSPAESQQSEQSNMPSLTSDPETPETANGNNSPRGGYRYDQIIPQAQQSPNSNKGGHVSLNHMLNPALT